MVKPGLLLAGLVVLGTAACGSNSSAADPKVASLATGGAAAPAASASADRPRLRLDDTAADQQRAFKPYFDCMLGFGIDVAKIKAGEAPAPAQSQIDKADQTCAPLQPLPPWEEDPTNPKSKDFWHVVVTCLQRNGVKGVHEVTTGNGGYEGGDANKIMDHIGACEREGAKAVD